MEIIKTVTDWPVIVQGALGSALFWAVLEIGQRAVKRASARLGKDLETANWFAMAAHDGTGSLRANAQFFCVYGALHYILKGFVVTALSLVVSPWIDVFATVGYLISAYFFFRALAFVPHTASLGPIHEREKRFAESLEKLDKEVEARKQKGAGAS
jgi:hypothetical protein